MIDRIINNPQYIYFAGVILLIPALMINLGTLNIFMAVDEATRALVALEMMISENYIVPTINGELYYNKPPLFSWILVFFFNTFGTSELVLRLPTVISLCGFGLTIYFFVSRELGKQTGVIAAFALVTSGRILFWESLLGYIDITFSWVVYTGIMFMIHFFRRRKFLMLFLVSYGFMTVGFMLKGLPAIVFQGISLLVVFISEKEIRRLFSWQHLAGMMVFILITGIYYFLYNKYQPLDNVLERLWIESTKRTVAGHGLMLTVKQIFLFPFEMIYHYMPWTLLLVFLFCKGFWPALLKNQFLKLNLLIVIFNLLPYWTSPDVYPKYIMMLIPMVITVSVFFYGMNKSPNGKLAIMIEHLFFVGAAILTIGYLSLSLIPGLTLVSGIIWKSAILFCLSGLFLFLLWKIRSQRLVLFAIILIIGRIAFGSFIWPQRATKFVVYEQDAMEVAEITKDEKVYYYNLDMTQYGATYVITRQKKEIVQKEYNNPRPGVFYITDEENLKKLSDEHGDLTIYFSYPNVQDKRILSLIKLKE